MRAPLSIRSKLALSAFGLVALSGGIVVAFFLVSSALTPSFYVERSSTVPAGETVRPGPPVTEYTNTQDARTFALIAAAASILVLLLLALIAARVFSRRLTGPLREINDAARLAADGRFDQRVAVSGSADEIDHLAETFNRMLDEVSRLIAARSRFTANASHELRTPLTTTRALLDAAEITGQTPGPELLDRLRTTNDRMIGIVEALFALTRAENDDLHVDAVDLAAIVRAELHELGHDLRMETDIEAVSLSGDARLLRQLVRNLCENAVRYNTVDGWIRASLHATPSTIELTILNSTTAEVSEPERLVEAFRRATPRTVDGGLGLGLSLAHAIAERHGATLTVAQPEPGRFRARVVWPVG